MIEVAQTTWEFEWLLELLDSPQSILEVGIWEGGTLGAWLQLADRVVAIDDEMRDPGPDVWQAWAAGTGAELELLQGSSREQGIIESVRRSGPYDLVFIDADHSYEGAKADWLNYREMVVPGGMVAFHDITARPGYGVDRVWAEVKAAAGARTLEIVENSGRYNGIGVVWL